MKNARYRVTVTKDHLVFAAAHFITIDGAICERLHGHNWRVEAEVAGPLDENRYVYDFIALRDGLQKIVDRLDHHVLLPTEHSQIRVDVQENEVEVGFEERRWVFPRDECFLLPIEQTTAELIAAWIGEQWVADIRAAGKQPPPTVCISVEENFGQWARCEFDVEG